MLKLVISSIFFGSTLLGFSAEGHPFFEQWKSEDVVALVESAESDENFLVYKHVGMGLIYLYRGDNSSAIDNLIKAESFHENSSIFIPELHYWICFGKAIGYDNLGMSRHRNQSIGSMELAFYGGDDEDEDFSNYDSLVEIIEKHSLLSKSKDAVPFFKDLASRAKSADVRKYLMSSLSQLLDE